MAFTPPKGPKLLPDGREVVGTIQASYVVGVTPKYFPTLAEKHGLTRFASKNPRGVPAYFWLVEEVQALRAKRDNLVADVEPGEFIEAPFERDA
ncbi:hypothetical protein [Nocardioides mangrovi]|uniref:Uncharacterized protein n=1 Tax=Nocardioides mangrovi TaxID=2874580 RepID=A0ABS7U961_9ACTN|nr:hypothetical protein [Nocardioides mangrovi]MBZ5737513.1 hypothetical protein [Nocardioides mangrovi]